jgi:thioredoxin-dependent peroxiredoxin
MMHKTGLLAAFVLVVAAGVAHGQEATTEPPGPKVGEMAPDFSLPAATRYGLLAEPFRLSDHRGKTVVLAFFFQARTRG